MLFKSRWPLRKHLGRSGIPTLISLSFQFVKLVATRREINTLEAVGTPCKKTFESDVLRIVAFSDYRVQDIHLLLNFVQSLDPNPNLILYAGDDVERFHNGSENLLEQLAATTTHGLCAVVGNYVESVAEDMNRRVLHVSLAVKRGRDHIKGVNVYNVHTTPLVIGEFAVIGMEGSPPDEQFGAMGTVIYPEKSIARHLQLAAKAVNGKRLLVVSHTPPRGTLDLAIRFGKRSIGSVGLKNFLAKHRDVALVVCGHVHFCGGQSKKLGKTTVVNAASHDDFGAAGRVAIIEIRRGKVCDIQWRELWELTAIAGIKEARQQKLIEAGIGGVANLSEAVPEHIKSILKCATGEGGHIQSTRTGSDCARGGDD